MLLPVKKLSPIAEMQVTIPNTKPIVWMVQLRLSFLYCLNIFIIKIP